MNLADIQNETSANKQHYWGWLKDINAKQAEILLDFAKDAFEQEAKRGEQIDTKGNWLLGTSFAALSLATIVAPPAVRGLDPTFPCHRPHGYYSYNNQSGICDDYDLMDNQGQP